MSKNEKQEMGNRLTEGSVSKTLLFFSLPFVGAYLLQSLYSIVDLLIVSHLAGTYSISGVNIVGQVSQVVLGLAVGFLSGATVMIAQYLGAENRKDMEKTIVTAFTFILIFAVIATAVMLIFTKPILGVLQTPQECYTEARNYYVIYMAGTVFVFLYNAIAAVLRGMGDSKTPLYFVALATIVNVVLDILFVGPFKMGAAGAALATIISQAISVVLSFRHLKKIGFSLVFSFSGLKIHMEQLKIMLQIGIPAAIQETVLNAPLVVLIAVANTLGVHESAAVGIGAKINLIFILPVCALSASLSTIVGQNIGAGKMERVMKAAKLEMLFSTIYSFVICVIMWIFSKELLMIFTDDPVTLSVGANYFKGHCWDYLLLMPFGYCMGGLFIGMGHSKYVALANAMGAFISRIPLSLLLAHVMGLGVLGIGIAYPVSTFFTDLTYTILFLKGDWKKSAMKKIEQEIN